uniref:Uncharacterized protein n=1 Tax=Rhizophora mucronata TaxID=61149 RepID=A0A2P2QKK5_RHIMU
MNLLIAFS